MQPLDQETIQQFRAEVVAKRNLPTIPAVLTKILSMVNSEDTSARDLVAVIEQDQSLTAKLLRLANSAFFGQARKVATVPRAILVLGFSTVRNLSLGIKVWDSLAQGVPRTRIDTLWTHAVAVALTTKSLAVRLREADPDEAFTAGLLHDAGRILLASRFKEPYWAAFSGATEPIEQVEATLLGIDHAEVGGWLFEAWNLPPQLVEAVRQHHAAEVRPGLTAVLRLANRLVNATDLSTGTLAPEAETLLADVAARGITAEVWLSVIAELRANGGLSAFGGASV